MNYYVSMKKSIKLNDIKRQSNIYRDIIKYLFPVLDSRLNKTQNDPVYIAMFIFLNYMMKTFNLLKDIHSLLDKKRIDRANATLRSMIELHVFIQFNVHYPESVLTYHDHYIYHHIQDLKDILSTTQEDNPIYEDIKNKLNMAKNEMTTYIDKYGENFNKPLGWARICLEKQPILTIPKMMKILNIHEQMITIYRSLHKYVHLGNFNMQRDMVYHLNDITSINDSEISNLVEITFEQGTTILLTLGAMLNETLTDKGYINEVDILVKSIKKLHSINNSTAELVGRVLKSKKI